MCVSAPAVRVMSFMVYEASFGRDISSVRVPGPHGCTREARALRAGCLLQGHTAPLAWKMEKSGCVGFPRSQPGLRQPRADALLVPGARSFLLAAAAVLVTPAGPGCPLSFLVSPWKSGPCDLGTARLAEAGEALHDSRVWHGVGMASSSCCLPLQLPTTALITLYPGRQHPHPTPRATGNQSFH